MEVSGMKNLTPTENFSVEVNFGGTWRAMSDQCWAVLGLCWVHVGSFGGSMEVSGMKKSNPTENFSVAILYGAILYLTETSWNSICLRGSLEVSGKEKEPSQKVDFL